MKKALGLLIICVKTTLMSQVTHHASAEMDSFWQFQTVKNCPECQALNTTVGINYLFKTKRFGLEIGTGWMNKYSNSQSKFTKYESTNYCWFQNLNMDFKLFVWEKFTIDLYLKNRIYWSYYSFEKSTNVQNSNSTVSFKDEVTWRSPLLQMFFGPQMTYSPIQNLGIIARLGILVGTRDDFSFNFNKTINTWGVFGVGVRYFFPNI